ncbi:MAG: ribosome small subunit-dependent GTPase A, partial [Desulfatirhabdiaceae bacterium]
VGDWVCVEKSPTDELGLVQMLLKRRTALRRRSAGESVDYQMIAANVDSVIIVQSCHYDFNLKRLERYLVMVRDGGADACILLTKTDLVEPEVRSSQLAEIRAAGITAPVLTLSNVTQVGVDDFKRILLPEKTYCFIGSSGVGKSTIINHLLGREMLQTKGVSGTGEGRHTTVRRELILLEGGALVIDNPGMREFGILGAESGMEDSFSDITGLASGCRYRNCSHTNEPGCAVREAMNSGDMSQEHYDNYIKLRDESAFYNMSYVEKRKKERDFGRFIKSAKEDLKN